VSVPTIHALTSHQRQKKQLTNKVGNTRRNSARPMLFMFAIKIIFKNLIALGFWPDGCFFPSFKIIFSYLFQKNGKKRKKKKKMNLEGTPK
jgi:hypothetical protein